MRVKENALAAKDECTFVSSSQDFRG